jgi:hypothetical protein
MDLVIHICLKNFHEIADLLSVKTYPLVDIKFLMSDNYTLLVLLKWYNYIVLDHVLTFLGSCISIFARHPYTLRYL